MPHAVLVLLDLDGAAVLESPPHHVRVGRGALDAVRLVDGRPELLEVEQLDKVPDEGKGRLDDGALDHLVGGCDGLCRGGHFVDVGDLWGVLSCRSLGVGLLMMRWWC